MKSGVVPNSVMLARMGTLVRSAKARYWAKLGDGFGEDHVGAGFDAGGSAVEGGVEAFGGEGVGAGHDDEGGVGAGVDGGLDAVDHLFGGDDLLCRGDGRSAWPATWSSMWQPAAPALMSERTERARLKAPPKPVSASTSSGRVADVGDAADVGEDVVDGGDAEVGHAERAGGDATAGEVEGAVAGALGHAGVVGVDGADDLEGSVRRRRRREVLRRR